MKIVLNNKEVETGCSTIDQLFIEQDINSSGIAVALNNSVIKRELWGETSLSEGDNIIIVSAVYGG